MENEKELLPCPFCGKEPHTRPGHGYFLIECSACRIQKTADTFERAGAAWNFRVFESSKPNLALDLIEKYKCDAETNWTMYQAWRKRATEAETRERELCLLLNKHGLSAVSP
jgi:hypothetical protein